MVGREVLVGWCYCDDTTIITINYIKKRCGSGLMGITRFVVVDEINGGVVGL